MPRYSRSRSRTPPRRRHRRSYSSSTTSRSRSRSRSRSPLRVNPKRHAQGKKNTRGRSRSATPPRKGRGHRGGYKGSSSKHRSRRSRSYTPEKRRFGASGKVRSRSPQGGGRDANHGQNEAGKYRPSEQPVPQAGYEDGAGQSQQGIRAVEGPQLPPTHGVFREDYGKGVLAQAELPMAPRDVAYDRAGGQSKYGANHSQPPDRPYAKDAYQENEKTKYEAVSPEALRFETPRGSESPYDRKTTKSKADAQAQYYQVQEKYSQGQRSAPGQQGDPQNVKMNPPLIIRPIFDPYSVKIPRRKDEGLKEIFDRPELKARLVPEQQMQPEDGPETRFVAAAVEKKEPVVYRQDVHFTGTLPGGALPPQPHSFLERREPLILDYEPRRDAYLDPGLQYGPRAGPVGVGSQFTPGQTPGFQGPPGDQFGSAREVQSLPGFSRPAMFIPEAPTITGAPQSPVSYQYPPDDLPDIKGPHDLRHDLESRRKQMEQQQQQPGEGRGSKSRSRSRSRRMSPSSRQRHSRSRSRSPMQQYKSASSYHQGRSRSRERSEDRRSGDRRPIRERLGGMRAPKGARDNTSFSDDDNNQDSFKWSQKTTPFYHHDRREDRSKSRDRDSRDRDGHRDKAPPHRGSMRGSYRGARGRGYQGKNFIVGYNNPTHRGRGPFYNNRGARGGWYQPRYQRGRGGPRRSPTTTWTHDLFDKDKGDDDDNNGVEAEKKEKKKQSSEKGKTKKSVKQKSKTVKKAKKSKKSPSRTEPDQKNEGNTHASTDIAT